MEPKKGRNFNSEGEQDKNLDICRALDNFILLLFFNSNYFVHLYQEFQVINNFLIV